MTVETIALTEDDARRLTERIRTALDRVSTAWADLAERVAEADESDRDEFFARIVEVRTAGNGDPIAALIKRVNDERANRRRLLESTALFLLFRTWNAFRAGESLHKFQLGAPSRGRDPETGNRLPATWAAIPEPK